MIIGAVETVRLPSYPNLLLVQLYSDDGRVGLGDTFFGVETVEVVIHEVLAPRLLGRTIGEGGRSGFDAQDLLPATGTGAERRAASAVDIATWDLEAQGRGLPLWRLLGERVHESIPVYNTCAGPDYLRSGPNVAPGNWGVSTGMDRGPYDDLHAFLEQPVELARDLLARGVTGMKIWPFDPFAAAHAGQWISPAEIEAAMRPFRLIRAALGSDMRLLVELHGLWAVRPAAMILRALEEIQPTWVEDPIRPDDLLGLRCLAEHSDCRLAGGETLGGIRQHVALIEQGQLSTVIADIGWCGGLSAVRELGQLATEHGRAFALHNCGGPAVFAASVHLAATLPSVEVQESIRAFEEVWYPQLVEDWPRTTAGHVAPPMGTGHGARLRPEILASDAVTTRRTTRVGAA